MALDWRENELYSFNYIETSVYFGLKPYVDKTGIDRYEFNGGKGKLIFDKTFSLYKQEN